MVQVEHPVTEAITGVDLVEWQLLVASGKPLPRQQHQLAVTGAAVEVRLYAENPNRNFLPGSGTVSRWRPPVGSVAFSHSATATSPHIRVDSGVVEGDVVSSHYDPMIAKLIVWGPNRPAALRRLQSSLAATQLSGR